MPDEPQHLTVPAETAGHRLDQFVASALKRPRAEAQRLIAAGDVSVNGQQRDRDVRLNEGDTVVVHEQPPVPQPATPTVSPRVVAEDGSILVLDKPNGLIMHRGPGINEPTLADWLFANRPELRGVGEDPLRPGIVHRLDREASGLVIVAKTQAAYDQLKAAFQNHRVAKRYVALVHGSVGPDAETIRFPLDRSERDGKMVAKALGEEGRDAETSFTVVERIPPFTLLDVTTKTGRTHQVRAHLHAFGHPIAGDPLYHPKKRETKKVPPRLFLHAASLRFPHPDGGDRSFSAPLPDTLNVFLTQLRGDRPGPTA